MTNNENIIGKMINSLRRRFILQELFIVFASVLLSGGVGWSLQYFIFCFIKINLFCIYFTYLYFMRVHELKTENFVTTSGKIERCFSSDNRGQYHSFNFGGGMERYRDVLNQFSGLERGEVELTYTSKTKLMIDMRQL